MNNCCASNLDKELMIYYGYTTSNSASNVDKFIKNTNPIIIEGTKINEINVHIKEIKAPAYDKVIPAKPLIEA